MVNFVTQHENELYKFIYYCSIYFQIESLLDIITRNSFELYRREDIWRKKCGGKHWTHVSCVYICICVMPMVSAMLCGCWQIDCHITKNTAAEWLLSQYRKGNDTTPNENEKVSAANFPCCSLVFLAICIIIIWKPQFGVFLQLQCVMGQVTWVHMQVVPSGSTH